MKSKVFTITNLVSTFRKMNDGQDTVKASKFNLGPIRRAPGSGGQFDKIAHHQGVYKLDGPANFIVSGSTKENECYIYPIVQGRGSGCNQGKDYVGIDLVFTHPSGLQVADFLLPIGLEQYEGASTRDDRSNVKFYNIEADDCHSWKEIKHLRLERRGKGKIASAIGITKLNNQWILAIRSKYEMEFFGLSGDPMNTTKTFKPLGALPLNKHKFHEYQCVNLFFGHNHKLYLFGMPDGSSKDDECWLHLIHVEKENDQIRTIIGARTLKHIHFKRNGSGPRFKWASCIRFVPDNADNNTTTGQFQVISISAHVDDNEIKGNFWSRRESNG